MRSALFQAGDSMRKFQQKPLTTQEYVGVNNDNRK